MVRRRLTGAIAVSLTLLAPLACGHERDMSNTVEMPDTMPVMRALDDPAARDAMLDTMPGGEMARGDSAAAQRLLEDKLGH